MLYVSEVLGNGKYAVTDTKDGVTEPVDLDTLKQLRSSRVKVTGFSSGGDFAYPVVRFPDSDKFTYIGRKVGEPVFDAVLRRVSGRTYNCLYADNKFYTGNISGVSFDEVPEDCVLVLIGNDDGITFCSMYGQVLSVYGDGRYGLRLYVNGGTQDVVLRCISDSIFYVKPQVWGYVDIYAIRSKLAYVKSATRTVNAQTSVYRAHSFAYTAIEYWISYLQKIGLGGQGTQIDVEEALYKTRESISRGRNLVWFSKDVIRPFDEVARELCKLFINVGRSHRSDSSEPSHFASYGELSSDCLSPSKCNSILAFLTDLFFPTDSDSLFNCDNVRFKSVQGYSAAEVYEEAHKTNTGVLQFAMNSNWIVDNDAFNSSHLFKDYVSSSVYVFRSKMYTGTASYYGARADDYVSRSPINTSGINTRVFTLGGVYEFYHAEVMDFIGKGAVGDAAVMKDLAKMKILTGVEVSMNAKRVVTQLSVDASGCLRFPDGGKTVNATTVKAPHTIKKVVIPSGYGLIANSFLVRGDDIGASWDKNIMILNKSSSYKPATGVLYAATWCRGVKEEFCAGKRSIKFSQNGDRVSSLMAMFLFKGLDPLLFIELLKLNIDLVNALTEAEITDFEARMIKSVLKNGGIAYELTFKNSNLEFKANDFVNYLKLSEETISGCRALMALVSSQKVLGSMQEPVQSMFSRLFKALTEVTELMVDHVIRKASYLGWYNSETDTIHFVNKRDRSTSDVMNKIDVGVSTWYSDDEDAEW